MSPLSSGATYRREVFDQVGNFDPAFDACEDVEFNCRVEAAGLKAYTSPKLAVLYEPRSTYRGLARQMFRYGLGRARLHRKHPSAFSFESLVPVGFTLGIPLLATAPFLPVPLGAIVAAPYLLYLLLALVFGGLAAAKDGWRLFGGIVLAFPVIHVSLGLGYLWGRVSPMPTRTDDDA